MTEIKEAAQVIKNGGIVLFPTETVYGIGANGLNSKAVEKVYKAKGREFKNPINLLVSSNKMIEEIAENITKMEYKLMEAFFPGPLTIILKRKNIIPDIVTAGRDTVGVRMPSGDVAIKLVEEANVPIAAPSANLSGMPSGTNLEDIIEEFKDKVDYIINGGECDIGLESTIVKVVDNVPHILRPGAITETQIKKVTGTEVVLDFESTTNLLLPSNNHKHYKTKNKSVLVYDENSRKQIENIKKLSNKYENVVIISCREHCNEYKGKKVLDMGSKTDLKEISKNIFSLLRKADKLNPEVIIIEGVEKKRNWKSNNG